MADKRDGLSWWFEFAGLRITLTDEAVNISAHGAAIAAILPPDHRLHTAPYIVALSNPPNVRYLRERGHLDGFVTVWGDKVPTLELGPAIAAAARAEGLRSFTREMWANAVTRGQTDDSFETWQEKQWEEADFLREQDPA